MAFTGDGTRFVGDDGFVKKATFGAEILGDGLTPLPVGDYLVIKVAASSGFPSNTDGTAIAAGDVIKVQTGITITPNTDDDVVTLELSNQCDLSSWQMEFSKDEIEVTTLCDSVKTYRAGKSDMSGTLNGVFIAGTSDDKDGNLRQFIDIARQDGSTSWDRYEQSESIPLGYFYVNNDTSIADEMVVIAPFQLFGYGLGGEIGSAQSFSSSFRFANKAYVSAAGDTVNIQPTFYRFGDGS